MISYEDLSNALDRYNRKRRGEPVDEPASHYDDGAIDADDMIESSDYAESPAEFPQEFSVDMETGPMGDITDETQLPPQVPARAGGQPPYTTPPPHPRTPAPGYGTPAPGYPPRGGDDPNRPV